MHVIILVLYMCEFCTLPSASGNTNRDAQHSDFVGFFSADAIELAVRQAATRNNASRDNDDPQASSDSGIAEDDDDDDDGT